MNITMNKSELKAVLTSTSKNEGRALDYIRLELFAGRACRLTSCDTYRLVILEQGDPEDLRGRAPEVFHLAPKLFKALALRQGGGRNAKYILNTDMLQHDIKADEMKYPDIDRVLPREADKNIIRIAPYSLEYAAPYCLNVNYLQTGIDLVGDSSDGVWLRAKDYTGEHPLRGDFETDNFKAQFVLSPVDHRPAHAEQTGYTPARAAFVESVQPKKEN